MVTRRNFLVSALGIPAAAYSFPSKYHQPSKTDGSKIPMVISTWESGIEANKVAWRVIERGGRALDAVEKGVMTAENDPKNSSVGYGGMPDRNGNVTLDACIMNEKGDCGSVSFLKNIKNPISVARKVMEETPHVMLSGQGALEFALAQGFKKQDLLTKRARRGYKNWLKTSEYKPVINVENHDTISMLAIDMEGKISGACTTSGMAFKMHGRVGDSPIIGAGLYLDPEVGGAVATGHGEKVIETLGSFLIVELMRQGASPQEACEEALARVVKRNPDFSDIQVGYLAINMQGEHGAYCIHKGFDYALHQDGQNRMIDSDYYNKS